MGGVIQKITVHSINRKVVELEQKLDNIFYIEVGNGNKKKIPINEAILTAWNDIELIRDMNRLHLILKKRKGAGYWIMVFIFVLFMGFDVKSILTLALSKILG